MASFEESPPNVEHINRAHFKTVDYLLFSSLLVVSLGIGLYSGWRSRKNASTQDYLLGGRKMSPAPVALSLLGGHISAISILGLATEIYFYGTQITLNLVGSLFGALLVRSFILPILYPLEIVSINEYVGLRYNSPRLRKIVTVGHVVMSFMYIGFCLYTPSLTLSTVTSLPTWASTLIMGSVCTFYMTIGGVRAVVYTDVVQTLLMFGGVLLVVILCSIDLGGFNNVWHIADQGERIQFFNMDPSPFVRHTFWSAQVLGTYSIFMNLGLTQSTYQRFASVGSLTIARRLCLAFAVGLYCLWLVFYFSGLVAYATYRDCDPLTSGKIEKADQIIPYLVADKLSYLTGMSGIFVAAVYGGVLSSISTSGNSIACQLWEDLFKEFSVFKSLSDASATTAIKLISAATGVVGISLGLLVGRLGTIYHVLNSITGAISGPISGLYVAGIFTPWVSKKGALAGFITGITFNLWVMAGKFMRGGGSPPMLPLSTERCEVTDGLYPNITLSDITPTNFTNSTIASLINVTTTAPSLSASVLPTDDGNSEPSRTIYDISYCYNGPMGVLITVIVSSLFSFCTGIVKQEDVEPRYVYPACLEFHKRVQDIFLRRHNKSEKYCPDADATLVMVTKKTDEDEERVKMK